MTVQPKDATILVVEDNFQNFVLITRLLAYLGVKKCEWKASGWQVLEFAESLPHIDLILMDIFLPEEDGYQVLERLRAHPRFKDTLVVAVTADVSLENMERARSVGFDGFIGKPLDPDRFPNQIRNVLRGEAVWEPG
jgi:two-component system cell cycle response regulator DivK